ncbi:hypothetical protein L3Y34_009828 [Caenorhabditis briggsae]|uniref:Uncharacterized protein n=2 Tax=Caenorhabditis briggsae TaxID=6238 RepID=A0AAE9A9P8_CAEBR|nr:hypothetical protein L3Y34_009828 [Caenorhabditis briggsae]
MFLRGRRFNLSLDGIAISNDLQSILRATEFKRNAAMYQTELTEITRALDAARQRLMVAEQRTNQLSAENRELKAERDHLVNQIERRIRIRPIHRTARTLIIIP